MNTVKDLLTKEEMGEYDAIGFPGNVRVLHNALIKKLETDPDYEVWVPTRYYSYGVKDQTNALIDLKTVHYMVSNKGTVKSIRHKKELKPEHSSSYVRYKFYIEGSVFRMRTHRLVASCFVPRKEPFEETPFSELEVNHIDTDKLHNDFRNLEWCSGKHNLAHAKENGLYVTAPLLVEVCIEGKYKGFKFTVDSKRKGCEFLKGGYYKGINRSIEHGSIIKGCKWSFASIEDIEKFGGVIVPLELREMIINHNRRNITPP
jgi:NUMOD4 motif./HNH endonuclease.